MQTLFRAGVRSSFVLWMLTVAIHACASAQSSSSSERCSQETKAGGKLEVDVYLLGGQSNMQGVGKIADLPKSIPEKIPHAFYWNGSEFEPLVLGETKVSTRVGEFGPEIGFAFEIASSNHPVYLIKYHASGMPLHHGWNGDKWLGGSPAPGRRNFYPGETSTDPSIGTLYANMLKQFQAGVAQLQKQGMTPNLKGVLWMQGEQDSKQEESATSYAFSLRRLRKRIAEDMKTKLDLPLVFGQVLPHDPPLDRFKFRNAIREQMAACDSHSGKPESMVNTIMVSTDGFPLLQDTVHYDAQGQWQLGKAFAEAMKRMEHTRRRADP